jgi:hypothetical protein
VNPWLALRHNRASRGEILYSFLLEVYMRKAVAGVVLAVLLAPSIARADHDGEGRGRTLVKFDGGIGVIPDGSLNQDGSRNTAVRGIPAAGQIWVIEDLKAAVKEDGRIRVDGRGLILGAGNNVGRATGQTVIATLICEDNIPRSTDPVQLADNGDFRIQNAVLAPWPPAVCQDPRLLIRNGAGGGGGWFAAGILDFDSF